MSMVYFGAYARSGVFQKSARELGVGRLQFYAGVDGKKQRSFPNFYRFNNSRIQVTSS